MNIRAAYDREEEVLARIAWQYFMEGRNQAAIAKSWGFSRSKVSRMLDKARRVGLVEISIRSRFAGSMSVEGRLRDVLGLEWVAVVPDAGRTAPDILSDAGRMAAEFLDARIDALRVVGVGWGTTVSGIPPFVSGRVRHRDLTFVELLGAFSSDGSHANSYRIALPLSEAYGARASLINAPAIAASSVARDYFVQDSQIQRVISLGASADLAVVSVGSVDSSNTMHRLGYIDESVLQRVRSYGAVGDILGHFIDDGGALVEGGIEDRIVSVSLEDLRRMPVLAVAMGENKVRPLVALAKSQTIDFLVTSESTGELILEEVERGT